MGAGFISKQLAIEALTCKTDERLEKPVAWIGSPRLLPTSSAARGAICDGGDEFAINPCATEFNVVAYPRRLVKPTFSL
ncbi:hypothetical protein ACS0TY_003647 [Phlomoides rotata]